MNSQTITLLLKTLRLRSALASAEAHAAWSWTDVRGLDRLLAYEGAEVWLYRRLRALDASAPVDCMRALRTAAHGVALLGLRADAQTVSVLTLFRGAGIPCALIKGQARRAAASRYPYADARGVQDVDLLLPEESARPGWELLRQNGYVQCYPDPVPWSVSHHLPAIWDDNRVSVEVHLTTSPGVTPTEAWRRATSGAEDVVWNGVSVAVPSATELLWQALEHAVLDGSKGCRLSALLNVAAVLAGAPLIDWRVVTDRIEAGEARERDDGATVPANRILRWLATAADLAGTELPAEVTTTDRIGLVSLLRWRGMILSSRLGPSVKDRLLEEAARYETGMPLSPAVEGTGMVPQMRRRTASLVARFSYAVWRH